MNRASAVPTNHQGQQTVNEASGERDTTDSQTAAQVKAVRSRSNSWFSQVKMREAKLQAAEDKALEKEQNKKEKEMGKKDIKEAKKSGFFGSAIRRMSSGSRKDRRDSSSTAASVQTTTSSTYEPQSPRMTLNRNVKRKRTDMVELKDSSLRRVCFQLDELVELRTYRQVEADDPKDIDPSKPIPTVKDMTAINPYASSTPLDRAILYGQCCKVYRTEPIPEIAKQLSAKGPFTAPFEGPRKLEVRNITPTYSCVIALADCLGLPLTGKHLTEVVFDNCGLDDAMFQLLLSCLYSAASLERFEFTNNPQLTSLSIQRAICFLCLSPQLQQWVCTGPNFNSECARLLTEVLSDGKVRALRELGVKDCQVTEDDLCSLITAARSTGVIAFHLRNTAVAHKTVELLAPMMQKIYMLDLSLCKLGSSIDLLVDSLSQNSTIISLGLESCGLSGEQITSLLRRLTILPNFRQLNLSGHDMRPLMPVLRETIPKMAILRRLQFSSTMLESSDIVALCDILASAKISELILTGIPLDSAALSALYALARVSGNLVNLELDMPRDAHGEKLGRKILAECIRNMETREANLDFVETDVYASVVDQHKKLLEDQRPQARHEELRDGAEGVATALVQHLDTTEEENVTDVPLAMFERARHIQESIEPALSEPLSDLQRRRLMLVSATLSKVIARFEAAYPECRQPAASVELSGDVYEHTGKSRAEFIPRRRNDSGTKSRQLEAEEGEMMKLAHRMTDRLHVLQSASASASASASPSRGPSRGELQDRQEAEMLEKMNQADGDVLRQKLHELQSNRHDFNRSLGAEIV